MGNAKRPRQVGTDAAKLKDLRQTVRHGTMVDTLYPKSKPHLLTQPAKALSMDVAMNTPNRNTVIPLAPLEGPTLERHLGASLKEARKESRKTQAEAADFLEVTHSAIGQWERGLTLPSLTNLISIAELYGASLDRLVWNMQTKFDARLRELPTFLRDGLIARWTSDLEEAERMVKRFPEMTGEAMPDKDSRVVKWSKAARARREKLTGPR